MIFKFKYEVLGGHTHVNLFVNGGRAGSFVLHNDEFWRFRAGITPLKPDEFVFIEVKTIPGASPNQKVDKT